MEVSAEDLEGKEILVTGAAKYVRESGDLRNESTAASSSRKSSRNLKSRHFKCKVHDTSNASGWTEENSTCDFCLRLEHREQLPNGILPRQKHVVEYILTLKHVNFGKQIDFNRLAAQDIIMQWVYCNVYTADVRTVMRSIEGLFIEYRKLGKFSTKSPGYWKPFDSFVPSMKDLFDVVADSSRQKTQKKLWGPEFDEAFYKKTKSESSRRV